MCLLYIAALAAAAHTCHFVQMDAAKVPRPLPCTAKLSQDSLVQAVQHTLESKADAFLQVRCHGDRLLLL